MEQTFRNYQINHKFQEKGGRNYFWKLRKKKVKKLKTFQKLLEQISQNPQYNQSRQSQSSRGNVYEKTDQELGISGNTTGNWHTSQPNNPSEKTIFGSNKVKEQHETIKLQNEEVMHRNI